MKVVKIAITTAEAKSQSAPLPTAPPTPTATQYTSQQFQQLSAKVAQLTMELATVRGEREALQAIAAAPAVSTEDRLTAVSEEMLTVRRQNEYLGAEITALSQDASPRTASDDGTFQCCAGMR